MTPEKIATHIAQRTSKSLQNTHKDKQKFIVVDAFCGCGGNTIQFAMQPNIHVIAIEIDAKRLEMAKHNALTVHQIPPDKITFWHADFFECIEYLKTTSTVDAVFLSPPWGGPEYINDECYSLDSIQPVDGFTLFRRVSLELSRNIVYFLPRNTNVKHMQQLLLDDDSDTLEIEQQMLSGKLKTLALYFGELQMSTLK